MVNLNMEMLSIRSVCSSVLAILYRKTLTTQGPCGTITTFDPQGMRLFQDDQISCITYQSGMAAKIRNSLLVVIDRALRGISTRRVFLARRVDAAWKSRYKFRVRVRVRVRVSFVFTTPPGCVDPAREVQ